MEKVKLIGVLLAAVIAATPARGLTGNVLSFKDNAIVVDAADQYGLPDDFRWPGDRMPAKGASSYKIDFNNGNLLFYASASTPILISQKNGSDKPYVGQKGLFLLSNGTLVIRNRAGYPGNWWWDTKSQKVVVSPAGKYSNCMLAMQLDGNLVIYANQSYNYAIWYSGMQPHVAGNGNYYTYKILSSGQFQIEYNGIICNRFF